MKSLRRRVQLHFDEKVLPSRTKQAFKDECDVNNILAKYQKTQLITHVNSIQGSYGDFSDVKTYQDSLNAVMDANDRFMGLPATIRARFANDPAKLLAFVSDSKNMDEAIKLGLIDSSKAQSYLDAKSKKSSDDLGAKIDAAIQKTMSKSKPGSNTND